jgi:hypothetical protein
MKEGMNVDTIYIADNSNRHISYIICLESSVEISCEYSPRLIAFCRVGSCLCFI